MTKSIRITNGDTSDYNVKVSYQYLVDGVWVEDSAPATELNHPGSQTTQLLYEGRRIVITENGPSEYKYIMKEGDPSYEKKVYK